MLLVSSLKAEILTDLLKDSPWLQRKNFGHSPAFAIGLMGGDGKPKVTQDWMVPCTNAKHQFGMENIMNRLDAYPFTRGLKPNRGYRRQTGSLIGTGNSNCKISNIRQTAKCYNPRDRSSAEK